MLVYLACFDISDDAIRYRVGNALSRYGNRVQRSVFEVTMPSETELARLAQEIQELLEPEDDMRFYALCRACRRRSRTAEGTQIAYFPAAVVI